MRALFVDLVRMFNLILFKRWTIQDSLRKNNVVSFVDVIINLIRGLGTTHGLGLTLGDRRVKAWLVVFDLERLILVAMISVPVVWPVAHIANGIRTPHPLHDMSTSVTPQRLTVTLSATARNKAIDDSRLRPRMRNLASAILDCE